ncbi:MAG: hypothetical protein WCL70_07930 [Paludibacter sp.]
MVIAPVEEMSIKLAMQLVTNWSKSTAQRKIDLCRSAMKKKPDAVLTTDEFIEYFELRKSISL